MFDLNPSPVLQTPSPRCGEGRDFGFTLAEVLITLGIIGVVAALTLPTLISNYKKQTYVTGLQKAYSVLNNVTKDAMAKDDVTNFSDTQLMQLWKDASYTSYSSEEYMAFSNELKKYYPNAELLDFSNYGRLPLIYSEKETGRKDSNYHLFKTGAIVVTSVLTCLQNQDSILYCFSFHQPPASSYGEDFMDPVNGSQGNLEHILVDVNGFKKPNQLGRDIFIFSVGYKSGKVVPAGSKAINDDFVKGVQISNCGSLPSPSKEACYSAMVTSFDNQYNSATQRNNYCFNTEAQKKPEGLNLYCADKIIKEGWKMNY